MIINDDALTALKTLDTDSIDAVVTDPPYGYSFMNKDWDKAVIGVETWKEVLRVLKPGAFAAIMSSPRQDVLSRMIVNLQTAGFRTDFTSIYWTYASGFPKAANISKLVDKRNGRHPDHPEFRQYIRSKLTNNKKISEINRLCDNQMGGHYFGDSQPELPTVKNYKIIKHYLDLDNRFDELIEREEAEREITGQKNTKDFEWHKGSMMSKETTDDYTTKTRSINITKSATEKAKELDGSYAGFQPKPAVEVILMVMKPLSEKTFVDQALANGKGITWLDNCKINQRFTANLLVSDSVLNSHSKYFDLDSFFIAIPKAHMTEKGKTNKHPTVKPLKLMSYLITLLSREQDTILDPFAGSGTTLLAAKMLNRKYIGIELNPEYVEIANKRLMSIL